MTRSRFLPRGPGVSSPGWWCVGLCTLSLVAPALGQSLGDAARKERARRQDPDQTRRAVRTVTEAELATNEGQLANDPSVTPAEPTANEREATPFPRGHVVRIVPASPQRGRGEAYWRTMVTQARHEVALAREYYADLQRQIRFGQPPQYINGRRVIKSAQTMKAMADVAEEELRRAEEQLEEILEEARRDGALPGWLREGVPAIEERPAMPPR